MSNSSLNLKLIALELQAKLLEQLDDFNVTELECIRSVVNRDLHGDASGIISVKLSIDAAPAKFPSNPLIRWSTKPHTIEVYQGPVVLTKEHVHFLQADKSKTTRMETNMLYSGIFFHDRLSTPGETLMRAVDGRLLTLVACSYGVDDESISIFVEHYVKNWGQ